MIDLRNIETFYWVATLGGFRRAAQKLNTTQPAISTRIGQLEQTLNTRLLDRGTKKVALTPKGIEMLMYAERLLGLRSEMLLAMGDRSSVRGTVRLGTSESIVHTWLSTLVQRVNATYPRVTLEITVDVTANLRDFLIEGELDIALLMGPISAPRVRNVTLCEYPLACLAAPGLDLPEGRLTLAQLTSQPIITFARTTRPYMQLAELFSRGDLPSARIFTTSSMWSIVRMAMDGIGTCVIPPAVVPDELAGGRLRRLATELDELLPPLLFTASYLDTPDRAIAAVVADIARDVADAYRH
ncbi:MAG: LysR family transcriptional regulator [Alphaproteobacteria bacterium]